MISGAGTGKLDSTELELFQHLVGDPSVVDVEEVNVLEPLCAKRLAHRNAWGCIRRDAVDEHFIHGAREGRVELDRVKDRGSECVDGPRRIGWLVLAELARKAAAGRRT